MKRQLLVEDLPFLPIPKELENLSPISKELEEKMRFMARHAVGLIAQKIIDGDIPPEVKKKTRLSPKASYKKK